MEVRPCGNNKAMIDMSTGLEIDCGNGPHRQDCPPGSYCHITLTAARCCPKSKFTELQYNSIEYLKNNKTKPLIQHQRQRHPVNFFDSFVNSK